MVLCFSLSNLVTVMGIDRGKRFYRANKYAIIFYSSPQPKAQSWIFLAEKSAISVYVTKISVTNIHSVSAQKHKTSHTSTPSVKRSCRLTQWNTNRLSFHHVIVTLTRLCLQWSVFRLDLLPGESWRHVYEPQGLTICLHWGHNKLLNLLWHVCELLSYTPEEHTIF